MSEKLYTDEELCWATQVAYCNVTTNYIEKYKGNHNGESPTLQQIFSEFGYGIYYDQDLISGEQTGNKLLMQESARAFIDDVIAGKICQDWKVVSVSKDQQETGFYGLTIETGADDAIVAFRGSESVDANNIVEGWLVADGGIASGELIEQEIAAGNYLAEIKYQNIAVTGHSLGGDLARAS